MGSHSIRRVGARNRRRLKWVARIGVPMTMAVAVSLPAPTVRATPATLPTQALVSTSMATSNANGQKRARQEAAQDKFDEIGPILNAIGGEGAAIVGGDPDGLYIYAELDDGAVVAGVFKDEGETVRYFEPTPELVGLLHDAWEAENWDEALRWVVMEYEVDGSQFDAQFRYAEELDPNEDSRDRRRAALKERYGGKPVIYPPVPEHFQEVTSE